jgi:hypothetical protein
MAATFLDLIVVLLCPFALSAVAWIIFIGGLDATDEISLVVKALTRADGVEKVAKRKAGFFSPQQYRRDRKRRSRLISSSFQTHAASSRDSNGERPRDEKNIFARRRLP